ncbi:MotB family protein [Nitratireductor rhodophyticola]|uniref:MotB family protein n=1 Tax=Nitratireductor rhodophyticola TaxID=2854036 RepID=A0ABS7R9S4_9HYPH|nr:MotB family protein [Nitratireductor rhodophyticola]MBY8917671.1 MotB family protein [Nitratireductor rhodophyticola]MBY8922382.1 MotB family protein [Nitratireductor rhodophyticola]WPZ12672.1 MotB family protein [Nitratireductor rhodophyticola]
MSVAENEDRASEIIIVRRGGGGEDEGHHGGAWKIAFADFMTAMMCFFLVMWLINATDDDTKTALASYFNPVQLIDRNTSSKGLEDVDGDPVDSAPNDVEDDAPGAPSQNQDQTSGPMSFENAVGRSDTQQLSDENLFSDPYAVLAEIASNTDTMQNVSNRGDGGAQTAGPSSGASGGESYRDPFAPDFWSQQVARPQIGVQGDPDNARENPAGSDTDLPTNGENAPPAVSREAPETDAGTAIALEPVPEVEPVKPAEREEPTPQEEAPPAEPEMANTQEAMPQPASEEAVNRGERLAEQIRAQLAAQFAGTPLESSISVVATDEGVLVSITDDLENGMFPVGSAVPQRELVLAMDKIGQTLSEQAGKVSVRGHTDGRPFRSETYDNWRLSSARAQAAYYMLVRGGLDEMRIEQVAGFADRKLKVPEDPYASANRRIEILLEVPR